MWAVINLFQMGNLASIPSSDPISQLEFRYDPNDLASFKLLRNVHLFAQRPEYANTKIWLTPISLHDPAQLDVEHTAQQIRDMETNHYTWHFICRAALNLVWESRSLPRATLENNLIQLDSEIMQIEVHRRKDHGEPGAVSASS